MSSEFSSDIQEVKTHHGEKDVLGVLEGIQESNKPRRRSRRENVALRQYVSDLPRASPFSASRHPRTETTRQETHLVHLCEGALLHLFERDDLLRLLVPSEVHFAVPTLPDLSHDMELLQAEFGPPFPERGPFALSVRGPFGGELLRGEVARRGGLLEGCEAGLARREVSQEVKVVVVKVCFGVVLSVEVVRIAGSKAERSHDDDDD